MNTSILESAKLPKAVMIVLLANAVFSWFGAIYCAGYYATSTGIGTCMLSAAVSLGVFYHIWSKQRNVG